MFAFGANQDPETGTPYGVVALDGLEDWVWDEFFNNGENLSEAAALEEYEAELGREPTEDEIERFWDYHEPGEDVYALDIPSEGLHLGLSYLGGAALVWVYKSPHTASVRPCSPCVPGAGDLDSKVEDGMICYDLPAEWYYKED